LIHEDPHRSAEGRGKDDPEAETDRSEQPHRQSALLQEEGVVMHSRLFFSLILVSTFTLFGQQQLTDKVSSCFSIAKELKRPSPRR
jgi:hypothetical protein